jgi:hypothetical protein
LHESRHKHASRRKRDSNGRFISKRLKNQVITHLGLEYERKEDEFTLQGKIKQKKNKLFRKLRRK